METTLLKMLLISSVSGQYGKYQVYVEDIKSWPEAQSYCREHFYDLLSIDSLWEEMRLRETYGTIARKFWIGLYRDPNNLNSWKWSGGGNAPYINWAPGQPEMRWAVSFACACWNCDWALGWHDVPIEWTLPFFCLAPMIVVEEKKTWEEALEHCREHHTDLISLLSGTQVLLAKSKIQGNQTSDPVWVGLSYLGNRWLWVNGDSLEYEAWTQGGDQHMCPRWSHSCGALTKEGLWENRDCQKKLNFICY